MYPKYLAAMSLPLVLLVFVDLHITRREFACILVKLENDSARLAVREIIPDLCHEGVQLPLGT